jgi:hypothetical protein
MEKNDNKSKTLPVPVLAVRARTVGRQRCRRITVGQLA